MAGMRLRAGYGRRDQRGRQKARRASPACVVIWGGYPLGAGLPANLRSIPHLMQPIRDRKARTRTASLHSLARRKVPRGAQLAHHSERAHPSERMLPSVIGVIGLAFRVLPMVAKVTSRAGFLNSTAFKDGRLAHQRLS